MRLLDMRFFIVPVAGFLAGCGDKTVDPVDKPGAPRVAVRAGGLSTKPSGRHVAVEEPQADLPVAARAVAARPPPPR